MDEDPSPSPSLELKKAEVEANLSAGSSRKSIKSIKPIKCTTINVKNNRSHTFREPTTTEKILKKPSARASASRISNFERFRNWSQVSAIDSNQAFVITSKPSSVNSLTSDVSTFSEEIVVSEDGKNFYRRVSIEGPRTGGNLAASLDKSKDYFKKLMNKNFKNPPGYTLEDFTRERVLGRGAYGTVVSVHCSRNSKTYAMKILKKRSILAKRQMEKTHREKCLLQAMVFPFVVNLRFFFSDRSFLYFVMPLAQRGDMYLYLCESKRFSNELARFYAAQVLMGLEYLHYLDLVYRDLKPENIVLFDDGYLKITDFGLTKVVTGRTYTLCGTPEYMAPEIIKNVGYGKSVDWWAYGILIYEMAAGFSPFASNNNKETYENILKCKLRFPSSMSVDIRSIVKKLVEPDLTRRFGNLHGGVTDIKSHAWFSGCDWEGIFHRKLPAPSIPPESTWLKSAPIYKGDEFKISSKSNFGSQFEAF